MFGIGILYPGILFPALFDPTPGLHYLVLSRIWYPIDLLSGPYLPYLRITPVYLQTLEGTCDGPLQNTYEPPQSTIEPFQGTSKSLPR